MAPLLLDFNTINMPTLNKSRHFHANLSTEERSTPLFPVKWMDQLTWNLSTEESKSVNIFFAPSRRCFFFAMSQPASQQALYGYEEAAASVRTPAGRCQLAPSDCSGGCVCVCVCHPWSHRDAFAFVYFTAGGARDAHWTGTNEDASAASVI